MSEREIVRDKRRVLEHLRTAPKFMPYLHSDMSLHGVAKLLGSRDRAQRALVALVQDGKIRYLENCSPDHYQAYAGAVPVPPDRELFDEIQRLRARVAELEPIEQRAREIAAGPHHPTARREQIRQQTAHEILGRA